MNKKVGKYRKKPIVIDAIQFNGSNFEEIFAWARRWHSEDTGPRMCQSNFEAEDLVISTLEGNHLANKGDWIIRGVEGEFYPCKPDIFEKTYEKVENEKGNKEISAASIDKEFVPKTKAVWVIKNVLEQSINSHVKWIDYIEEPAEGKISMSIIEQTAGGISHHKKCIKRYKKALDALKSIQKDLRKDRK